MKIIELFKNILNLRTQEDEDQMKSGTGFMINLTDTIKHWQNRGYTENLVPEFDHLSCHSGQVILFPKDFYIEKMIRFENSSDPSDQSLLYVISSKNKKIKGLYIESYGIYHDELSNTMIDRIKHCRSLQQKKSQAAADRSLDINF